MIHPTTHLPKVKPCYESPGPRDVEGSIEGRTVPFFMARRQHRGTVPLEAKKAQGLAIASNIDVGTPMAELYDTTLLEPGYVDYAGGHWSSDSTGWVVL